jgi:L-ribulokinase
MIGLEAGQSAFGDTYAWFSNVLAWPLHQILDKTKLLTEEQRSKVKAEVIQNIIPELSRQAAALPLAEQTELAVDWLNGRRTPDADQTLKGAMAELNLASGAPQLFRAWVEATCFGAKAIVDRFREESVPVKGLIGLGGVARKSPYVMQVMADVMDMPIRIHRSEQTCAAGAAMFAAVASGIYPMVEDAMQAMGQGFDAEYRPDPSKAVIYKKRYKKYQDFGAWTDRKEIKVDPVVLQGN